MEMIDKKELLTASIIVGFGLGCGVELWSHISNFCAFIFSVCSQMGGL